MTSKQRSYLKGLAMNIEPVMQVGKGSITPEFVEGVAECFNTRELIKLSVLKNCFDDPGAIAQTIAERTGSQVVQVIGRKIVLYKRDKKNPKIELPH
ncbi:MAG: ribosome assembly RNA-binding protein YhbY [Lachnospiraceae bacterium]|nr:ribosome assembly RNA-binding protein YhbY [Lachnospiraceae bacterium]